MSSDLEKKVQWLCDIEEIKQLKARYANACDDDYNPDTLAPMFVEDAIWDGGALGYCNGRDEIHAFFSNSPSLVSFAVHQITTPIITIDGDTATGKWFTWQPWVVQGTPLWMSATYNDEYIKTDGQWHFKHVKVNIRMLSPQEGNFAETRILEMNL